jgi:hypothetical protein
MKAQPLVTVQSLRSRPIASSSIAAVAPRATIHQRQGADSPAGAFTAPSTEASSAHGLKPAEASRAMSRSPPHSPPRPPINASRSDPACCPAATSTRLHSSASRAAESEGSADEPARHPGAPRIEGPKRVHRLGRPGEIEEDERRPPCREGVKTATAKPRRSPRRPPSSQTRKASRAEARILEASRRRLMVQRGRVRRIRGRQRGDQFARTARAGSTTRSRTAW